MKSSLEKRRIEVARELGVPIEKVTIYPYREPKGTLSPTPWQIKYATEFIESGATTIYTAYATVKRERLEEVIACLKN